jgi:hypothetical protein
MSGFGINHNEGTYILELTKDSIVSESKKPPLTTLEDWYVLYLLIPGKVEKANIIEQNWRITGRINCRILEAAYKKELPTNVKLRIEKMLSIGNHQ